MKVKALVIIYVKRFTRSDMKQLSTVKWSTKSESVLNLLLLRQFGCPSNIRDFTSAQVLGVEDGKAEVVINRCRFGQNHQKVRKLLLAWQCGDAFSYILAFEQTERWPSDLDIEWTKIFFDVKLLRNLYYRDWSGSPSTVCFAGKSRGRVRYK